MKKFHGNVAPWMVFATVAFLAAAAAPSTAGIAVSVTKEPPKIVCVNDELKIGYHQKFDMKQPLVKAEVYGKYEVKQTIVLRCGAANDGGVIAKIVFDSTTVTADQTVAGPGGGTFKITGIATREVTIAQTAQQGKNTFIKDIEVSGKFTKEGADRKLTMDSAVVVYQPAVKGYFTFTGHGERKVSILKVELKEGATVANEGDYVYINATPQMPQLKASLKPTGLAGNAKWRLYIEYTRPDRGSYTGDRQYYPGPDASTRKTLSASATWDIAAEFGADFRGGKATLYCEYQGVPCDQVFHIRGNNPTEAAVKTYLDAGGPWFAYCIAKHESDKPHQGRYYAQFNEEGTLGPNPSDFKKCPNRGTTTPYGWGIMQLTHIELPGQTSYRHPDSGVAWAQELWSWKANCDTAFQVLTRKKEMSITHLKQIAPDGAGDYIMPPDITVSGVLFTGAGPRTPDQLDVIKLYNGGYFWTAYNKKTHKWTHVPLQSEGAPSKDYTEKVLDEY